MLTYDNKIQSVSSALSCLDRPGKGSYHFARAFFLNFIFIYFIKFIYNHNFTVLDHEEEHQYFILFLIKY